MHPGNWVNLLRWRRSQPTPQHSTTTTTTTFVRPTSSGRQQAAALGSRVDHVEDLTRAVLYVTIVTLVGVVVSVAALVLDQMRFNSESLSNARSENTRVEDLTKQVKTLQEAQESGDDYGDSVL